MKPIRRQIRNRFLALFPMLLVILFTINTSSFAMSSSPCHSNQNVQTSMSAHTPKMPIMASMDCCPDEQKVDTSDNDCEDHNCEQNCASIGAMVVILPYIVKAHPSSLPSQYNQFETVIEPYVNRITAPPPRS